MVPPARLPLARQQTSQLQATQLTEALGYRRREIPPDGNCLFRACAEICFGSQSKAELVRSAARDYVRANRARFEPFLEEDFDAYVEKMGQDGYWGSDLEIHAIAELFNTRFTIFQSSQPPFTIGPSAGDPVRREAALWFSHGNHYDALYRPDDFAERGFSVEHNAELDRFREQRAADEAMGHTLMRELSVDAPAADAGEGELAGRSGGLAGAEGGESAARRPRGALSDELKRRPTIVNLLDAGLSEAEIVEQLDAWKETQRLPAEIRRRPTVVSLLEAGVSEDEIRRSLLPGPS